MSPSLKKIAFLATGDEITNGDIVNSNTQIMSKQLFSKGMSIGTHMSVPDNISSIVDAIHHLLKNHAALIITGGLGPTSDDVTRYGLSKAIHLPLIFDETAWENIVKRLLHFGYTVPPDNNRQQALFPEGARILVNTNGTASGCAVEHHQKLIFMLPGPPQECIPLFEKEVLPELTNAGFQEKFYFEKWFLFSVSEGHIAADLEEIIKNDDCKLGYRLCYPYLELKLYSRQESDFFKALPALQKIISPYLIGDGKKTATDLLLETLKTTNFSIDIQDCATYGLLETMLLTPQTFSQLKFGENNQNESTTLQLTAHGLDDYWQGNHHCTETNLHLKFESRDLKKEINTKIPFRGERVKLYAVEFIAARLHEFILSI